MDKKEAIEFLKEKIKKINHLAKLPYKNQEYPLWCNQISDVLEEIFGKGTTEYIRFSQAFPNVHVPGQEQEEYLEELKRRESALKSIITKYERLGFESKSITKSGQEYATESPIQLFDAMRFHPRVVEASRELFKDSHYRDAIYRAFVEVNNIVKQRANSQLDGKKLMSNVFNPDNPIIKLNPLKTPTDRDEQEGFMYLFMGAMQGIRNPKAHENIIQNNCYIALKLIGFASLLIVAVDFWEA